MLIGKLIEDLFDFLDVIAKDCCICDRQFTTLHPHLAAMIVIKLLNINVLTFSFFYSHCLLLLFLTASCFASIVNALILRLLIDNIRSQSGNGLNTITH